MYGAALSLSAATTAGTVGLPFFHMGELDVGIPLQAFGIIVATGVLIGAWLLRRYAEWHGISDDHIRGLLAWVTICGFVGAHVLDVLMYEPQKLGSMNQWALWPPQKWPGLLRIWDGISSYGGFVGGALGFAIYVWWKRLPVRLMADVTIVGLLPAFSIGRIGCTVVSDHIGAFVDKSKWYSFLAMEYPRSFDTKVISDIAKKHPGVDPLLCWNLGLIELLYLIPVNALILWLAFRSRKRMPAGFLVALTGVLYAPVRFFLEFLRPTSTDPLHLGLTFAQWASVAAFGAAGYLAWQVYKNGVAAKVVAPTSGEAQRLLRIVDQEEASKTDIEAAKIDAKKAAEKTASEKPAREKTSDSKASADDKKQVAKTEYSAGGPGSESANLDEPADEGAAVSQEEIVKAEKEPAPSKASKSDE